MAQTMAKQASYLQQIYMNVGHYNMMANSYSISLKTWKWPKISNSAYLT